MRDIRVFVWNCAGSVARKIEAIVEAAPDIAVLSEAEEHAAEHLGDGVTGSAWRGRAGSRGLAVIAQNGWKIEPSPVVVPENLFLPVILTRGDMRLHLIGACVQKTTDYVTPTITALDRLSDFIRDAPTILAGDFNQSVAFDSRRVPARRFATALKRLGELGMRSAWHSFAGETMGAESIPTLYWRWNNRGGSHFHIDYAFLSNDIEIASVALGSFDDYPARKLSDHVPLLVDLRAS